MFAEGYSFPHPVLGNVDDVSGEFNISVEVSRNDKKKIVFGNILLKITNTYIEQLIKNGKANCFIKVQCSSTFTTWMFESPASFEIDENDLVNKVELQFLVLTTTEIPDYSDISFNTQYGKEIFSLNKNEVIAISAKENISIPKVDEKLGLGNIFKFHEHKTGMPISFQYNQDKIFINYPVTKKGEHPPNMLFSTYRWTAFNIFIVPALTEALRFIDNDMETASRYEWFTVIDQFLPVDSRTKDYYADAQTILHQSLPVLLAYDELIKK